jgi:hypothetical protein
MSNYAAFMDAQELLRYYDYSLSVDSKRLAERIMTEDTSDIVATILAKEAEVARLKLVRP